MKKQLFATLLIVFHLLLIAGCKENAIPAEEGFTSFLADSTMRVRVTTINNPMYYEFGLKFQVLTKGRIVKLGTKLPNAGNYRICIWDFTANSILLEQKVRQTQPNKQAWVDISSLPIEADKDYFISVIANNWNDAYPKSDNVVLYPIIKGNIKILGFAYKGQTSSNASPVMPDMTDNIYSISGFIDFGFIPN